MCTDKQLKDHAAWVAGGRQAGHGRRIEMSNAYIGSRNLSNANLSGAGLRNVSLRGADLTCADLSFATLSYANLCGADLRGANLREADLSNTCLIEANMHGADLGYTDLRGAYLGRARGITSAGPVGRGERVIYAVDHGDRVMVQAGDQWDTSEAVIASIEADYEVGAMRDAYIATVRAMVAVLEAQR